MRKVLAIALNSLRLTARDKKALLVTLAMPMLLIGILGQALKGMMGDGEFNPFTVVIVSRDEAARPPVPPGTPAAVIAQLPTLEFGKILVDEVFGSERARAIIKVRAMSETEEALAELRATRVGVVVEVPPGFTAGVLAGERPAVRVWGDAGKPAQSEIVRQVVLSFTESLTSGMLAQRLAPPEELARAEASGRSAAEAALSNLPSVRETTSGARSVSAMQYYAAAMAIMFMMMTAIGRAANLLEERRNGTLARMLLSPTPRAVIIGGQMLGNLVILLAQFGILMLGTHLLYGVYWGDWGPALMLGIAFALASAGVGAAATAIFDDPKAADVAVGIVGNIFAALSGGMFPLYIFPDVLRAIAKLIPNYWALQGFLDLMSGVSVNGLPTTLAVLIGIAVATGSLGAWRLATK